MTVKAVPFRIRPVLLAQRFQGDLSLLEMGLSRYISGSDPEAVHHLRTMVRRFQASSSLLPRSVRLEDSFVEYGDAARRLFKTAGGVRDLDTVRAILLDHEEGGGYNGGILLEEVQDSRASIFLDSLRFARKVVRMDVPQVVSTDLDSKKVERRFLKLTRRYATSIQEKFAVVIESPDDVGAIHDLRKDCKRLRYLMQLSITRRAHELAQRLEGIQDDTGIIHDEDVTIEFLKRSTRRHRPAAAVLKRLVDRRKRRYTEFVRDRATRSSLSLISELSFLQTGN